VKLVLQVEAFVAQDRGDNRLTFQTRGLNPYLSGTPSYASLLTSTRLIVLLRSSWRNLITRAALVYEGLPLLVDTASLDFLSPITSHRSWHLAYTHANAVVGTSRMRHDLRPKTGERQRKFDRPETASQRLISLHTGDAS